ncbi:MULTISPECIES: hypothetical protein [Burkholderiaceae]|uniref:hypothetical protein n=1 Tax=Burkholderiaceae TaxID=119060 RepID=UPI00106698B7|nr:MULTISPECIES: hypothetical protein [Burkholderiaceae]MDP9546013.1 hypothetical protein [Burkholderia cepacia]UTP22429.1 hypothetical protein NMB33_00730 [Burkholderia sp. FXe9]HEP6275805.1 hypothetical protein [Burkholderia vietnamiensis]MBR8391246.1 hypothetical protein [Burkholderia cenocepacia]MBR8472936.1 hypothetical protein [Burkholderia cenocepacia]
MIHSIVDMLVTVVTKKVKYFFLLSSSTSWPWRLQIPVIRAATAALRHGPSFDGPEQPGKLSCHKNFRDKLPFCPFYCNVTMVTLESSA